MNRLFIKYAAIIAICMAVMVVVTMSYYKNSGAHNTNYGMIVGYSLQFVIFSIIFIAFSQYRNQYSANQLGFLKAWGIGLLIVFIGSTAYSLAWTVYQHFFWPNIMTEMLEQSKNDMIKQGLSSAKILEKMQEWQTYAEMYKSPAGVFLISYIEVLPMGIIVSLIAAIVNYFKTRLPKKN